MSCIAYSPMARGCWRRTQVAPSLSELDHSVALPGVNAHQSDVAWPSAFTRMLSTTTHRYSIAKFQALDGYTRQSNGWRIAAVLLGVPLPGLVASIVPCFLPLQDISKGPNLALVLHLAWAVASSTFGLILTWLEVTRVPRSTYSLPQLTAVCVLVSVLHCACFSCVVYLVLFPVPFAWVTGTPLLFANLAITHVMVFGTRIWRDATLRAAARAYGPSMVLQVSRVLLYPAFTVLYERASTSSQLALIFVFPFIKYAIKTLLINVSAQLHDFRTEVAVCGVEIAASIYQTMIMQISPSPISMACIIGIDVVYGLIVIKFFLDRSADPQLIAKARGPAPLPTISALPTRRMLISGARLLLPEASAATADTGNAVNGGSAEIRGVATTAEDVQSLRVALETLRLAEEILLTQYVEVVVPVVSCLFVTVASQLPSARFNPRIAMYHVDAADTTSGSSTPGQFLSKAVQSILVYSILQLGTLVLMQWLLWRRYGISAMSFLAFILEHHALSIIGKLIAWLPVIFHFAVVQYGTDFTFAFDSLKLHG